MANSVDPDQTAPEQSDLGLQFSYAILPDTLVYKLIGPLPYSKREEFEKISFRVGTLSEGTWSAEKQTGSHRSCLP